MNTSKVQTLINKEIAELHARIGGKAARKQLPVAKWQIVRLAELGILELMPAKFGHADAKAIIEAATDSGYKAVTPYGEGEKGLPHPLYVAINEKSSETDVNHFKQMINDLKNLRNDVPDNQKNGNTEKARQLEEAGYRLDILSGEYEGSSAQKWIERGNRHVFHEKVTRHSTLLSKDITHTYVLFKYNDEDLAEQAERLNHIFAWQMRNDG